MLNFCPECGNKLYGDRFCGKCGADLTKYGGTSDESENSNTSSALDDALGNLMGLAGEKQTEDKLRVMIIREMYDEAKKFCNELIDNDPMDKVGYIGLIRIASKNYKVYESSEIAKQIRIAEEIFGNPDELLFDREYANYIDARKQYFEEKERKRIEAEKAEAERKRKKAEEEQARIRAKQEAKERAETEAAQRRKEAEYAYNLGEKFYYGQGVSQSYEEAVKWYRKAAEQGHAVAQFNLGWGYFNGQGVTQNYAEAVKWYRKSAEQGHTFAQNNLGSCYGRLWRSPKLCGSGKMVQKSCRARAFSCAI